MGFIKNALGMIGDAVTGGIASGAGSFVNGLFGGGGIGYHDQKKLMEKQHGYELENMDYQAKLNEEMAQRNQNDYSGWQSKPKPELSKPKLLHYDLECTLSKSYHFGQYKQNLSVKQQVQEGHLLSHAWAWGDEPVVGSILTREEVLDHDPERLVLEAWSLLDNADVVVAHYGKKFDIPKLNGYFLKYGLQPPSLYKVVDTKEISSKKFLLPFNSLEYLAKALGVQQKIGTILIN